MLFRVCEHYNDDYKNMFQEKYNDCFICFEYKNNFENKPTTLRKQQLYFSNCNCDAAVHSNCLQIWLDKNKSCPICRNSTIVENNNIIIILQFVPFGIQIYSFSKKIFVYILKFLLIVLTYILTYKLFIDVYLLMFKNIYYIQHNDYMYVPTSILEENNCFENSNDNNINYISPHVS